MSATMAPSRVFSNNWLIMGSISMVPHDVYDLGLNKSETAALHGEQQVQIWRRSYDIPPPPLKEDDPRHPNKARMYSQLSPDVLPKAECLKDTVERFLPYCTSPSLLCCFSLLVFEPKLLTHFCCF